MTLQGRGNYRGGRGRGGGRGGRGGSHSGQQERKRENILDLSKYSDKRVRIKFAGGREVHGTLKGFDPLMNIVLDDTIEYMRDPEDPNRLTSNSRSLGLMVARGPAVILISPVDGTEEIANPFVQDDDE
ncbi:hypothetical protein BKA69DRAFT_1026038 [Paraphysoderma sedebokerense]|nr:hypothetical protein BKA69DRAFT_1026038 [Paraphysoderma sedebokerense]